MLTHKLLIVFHNKYLHYFENFTDKINNAYVNENNNRKVLWS
jgi:hypothetical protein